MPVVADLVTFRILYPEFAPVTDARIEFYLDMFNEEVSSKFFKDCTDKAVIYISAHELALSQNREANAVLAPGGQVTTSSGAGAITSASAGGISVGFASGMTVVSGSAADAYYSTTQYGLQYLALKRQCLPMGIQGGFKQCP